MWFIRALLIYFIFLLFCFVFLVLGLQVFQFLILLYQPFQVSNYLVLPLEFVVSCFYLSMWFLSSFVLYISPVWGLLTWFWLVVSVILDYYLTRVARFSKEKLLFNWNSKLTECPIFYLATLCLICYLLPQSSVYLMWHN